MNNDAVLRKVPCVPIEAGSPIAPLIQSRPADRMPAEATAMIGGALLMVPGFDGLMVVAGAPSVWASISAAEVVGFRTGMAVELTAGLAGSGVIDEAAFDAGMADGLARPEGLLLRLSGLRAEALADGARRGRIAGLLVGSELAGTRAWWLGQNVLVVGEAPWAGLYARALRAQGLAPREVDGAAARTRGLRHARGA